MSSRSQPLSTDSQVLDSVTITSEPIDVRNLFSSYTYDSPELNTLDGFQDFDGFEETLGKEVQEAESGGLHFAAKRLYDGIVKCKKPADGLGYSQCAAMVTGSSESLSLGSEPPDIKNWFSSYVYESPMLDTTDDFTVSDFKEREDDKISGAQQNNKDMRDFVDVEESADLPSHTRISSLFVKCTNSTKESLSKDDMIDPKPRSPSLSQSTSASGSEQIFHGQGTKNDNHGSVEKSTTTNANGKDYDANLDSSSMDITSHTCHQYAKSLHNSIGKKVHLAKDSKDMVKGNSLRRPTDSRSTGKENEGTELFENGFIATKRKSRREDTENMRKSEPAWSPGNGVNKEKDAAKVISRKVLSETSNFHSSNNGNIVEITGKWRCPQKSKPNLGPPLKQLRLEQWVRRV